MEDLRIKLRNAAKSAVVSLAGWGGMEYIPFLVLVVGQACNLKCRDCENLVPYAPKEKMCYKLEDFVENMDFLLKHAFVGTLQIQGGEPFIYPKLGELLDYLKKKRRVRNIVIATNGVIVPSNDM